MLACSCTGTSTRCLNATILLMKVASASGTVHLHMGWQGSRHAESFGAASSDACAPCVTGRDAYGSL